MIFDELDLTDQDKEFVDEHGLEESEYAVSLILKKRARESDTEKELVSHIKNYLEHEIETSKEAAYVSGLRTALHALYEI